LSLNARVEAKLQDIVDEVTRLNRLDHRLNKEMVSKPYEYIDKVKQTIDKEQKALRDIIEKNHHKFLEKIMNIDIKSTDMITKSHELNE
jgi:hemerythrin-like domain-containing protein